MSYISEAEFRAFVDRSLTIDAWMLFELTNAYLTDQYRTLTASDLNNSEQHRQRIIDVVKLKMATVNMPAAVTKMSLDTTAKADLWDVEILIPAEDPYSVLACTTFSWSGGYGVQRFREVDVSSTETALIINMKVRGMQRSRVENGVAAFLEAVERRLSDIAALIDEYMAAIPYAVRTDLMVLPSQLRDEARQAAGVAC